MPDGVCNELIKYRAVNKLHFDSLALETNHAKIRIIVWIQLSDMYAAVHLLH